MKNHKNKKRRRFITLIEIMIVMFLIALITGVVAYNYTGTLEKGKAFKTHAGIEKLQTILSLAKAENPNFDLRDWKKTIQESPLVKNADNLMKDGWGNVYKVDYDKNGEIEVTSEKYETYLQAHPNASF